MNPLKISDIKNITILGTGTMGLRIGLSCALNGYQCKLFDIKEEALESAASIQKEITKRMVENDLISRLQQEEALSTMVFTQDPQEAASQADLISESVTEDVLIKNRVWQQFGQLCPSHTIFTTNSSYLLPSMFANISGRPEQFCALHFHDVFHANVVDIMPHSGTAAWVVPLLEDFGKSLKQIPVILQKESSGYLFNNMLMAMMGAASSLLTREIGTVEDIDRSWMGNFKMPIGPFGLLDEVGLDTVWHIVNARKDGTSKKFAALLDEYVKAGNLGQKTGSGFYNYPNPRYQDEDFI